MERPLVFIHGSGDSGRIWRLQVERFGGQAFAIDLPGHGGRVDTLPTEVTVDDYARVVREIVRDELKLKRPVIVGHSLGGAIALMMGLEYGEEVGGLILVGTGARLRVHPALLSEAREAPATARRRITEMCVIPEHVSTVAEEVLREQVETKAGILYRDLLACDRFDVTTRLQEIQLPTMIICGSEDRLTPPKYSSFLRERMTGVKSGARLHILPEAGHYVMREQAETVNKTLEEWIGELGV